jgi:hypothetical protein
MMGAAGVAAKSGAKFGGGVSAGIAVVGGVVDLINGEKDLAEVSANVVVQGTKGAIIGGVSSAATTMAAPIIATGVSTAATAISSTAIGAAIGGTAAGAAIGTAAVAAAPFVAGAAIVYGIGSLIGSLFDW